MNTTRQGLVGLVGDVMIETPQAVDHRLANPPFKAAVDALNANAWSIINLEMPLSTRGYRVPKHSNLRSHPDIISDIQALGTDAVALANNHMMDYGPDALRDTLAVCSEAGIPACGAGESLDDAMEPVILDNDGPTIGLLSFASTLPVESDAGPGKPGIAPIRVGFSFEMDPNLMVEQPGTMPVVRSWVEPADLDRATAAIQALKKTVDVVIVALHWGVPPYWLSPSQGLLAEYQQPLGRALIDAGADIIWGHHSHVLHPIEVYNGKPIFYSLGNFIFEGPRAFMEPESLIIHIQSHAPLSIELSPIWVDDDGFPLLAGGAQADSVFSRLEEISQEYGTRFVRDGDRMQLVLADA